MKCEWCGTREATCAGRPHVGPLSRMCELCKKRVCKKDDLGQYVSISIEVAMEKFPKGFYFS
jgi:hypothetical protein